jgi:hypothetical protein
MRELSIVGGEGGNLLAYAAPGVWLWSNANSASRVIHLVLVNADIVDPFVLQPLALKNVPPARGDEPG